MIAVTHTEQQNGEIVLFHAGESLLEQVADWVRRHRWISLRLVSSYQAATVRRSLARWTAGVIDATQHPRAALRTLQQVLEVPDCRLPALCVYTERMHAALEMFVRRRGVLLLLGPMTQTEWSGFFDLAAPIASNRIEGPPNAECISDDGRTTGSRLLSTGDKTDRSPTED